MSTLEEKEQKIREEFGKGFAMLKEEIAGLYSELNMVRMELQELKKRDESIKELSECNIVAQPNKSDGT